MSNQKYQLPEYPCKSDVWDSLQKETRPIVIYGMGNGADKLFRRFEEYGIKVSDIFASDGFVRGHSFHGYRVKSFSEIKAEYSDFVIVLSFASNKEDVIDMLAEIDASFDMLVPDMPIADENEYFDREFYNLHYKEISEVYNSLADGISRSIYAGVLNYRLTGRISYLLDSVSDKDEMYSLIAKRKVKCAVDAGAYNGDTAKECLHYFDELSSIYAIEPDRRNFKKLSAFSETEKKVIPINAAVWSSVGTCEFMDSGNRNSTVNATASFKHSAREVDLVSIDSIGAKSVDYVKYDVEGAEHEALIGTKQTIERDKPALLISLYHRSRDIYFLPQYISGTHREYKLYIRRLPSIPAWELNLIALPIEYL